MGYSAKEGGDLNQDKNAQLNTKYKVNDVPNGYIYEYDKDTYDDVEFGGYQIDKRRYNYE